MLAAIATARDARLRRRALLCKVVVVASVAAFACALGILGALSMASPAAGAAEPEEHLSLEEAIWEAVDDDFPAVDWDHWQRINPDIVGWVTVRETGIDHPIVMAREESPAYYLSHGIDRSADPKGCVFLDAECEAGLDSMHSVIYGHNWKGGQVFGDLAKYADAEFAVEHGEILVQTPAWKARLEVQCVEIANGTDDTNVIAFANGEAMAEWYRMRYEASDVKLGEGPSNDGGMERILTFCTCAAGSEDKRVLVYAIPSTNLRAASREAASTA